MMYTRPHHQAIAKILERFDADFLEKNSILFGGGTRIALELGEFRESVDIDFFCIGRVRQDHPSHHKALGPWYTQGAS